jgi:hypothetical protein
VNFFLPLAVLWRRDADAVWYETRKEEENDDSEVNLIAIELIVMVGN